MSECRDSRQSHILVSFYSICSYFGVLFSKPLHHFLVADILPASKTSKPSSWSFTHHHSTEHLLLLRPHDDHLGEPDQDQGGYEVLPREALHAVTITGWCPHWWKVNWQLRKWRWWREPGKWTTWLLSAKGRQTDFIHSFSQIYGLAGVHVNLHPGTWRTTTVSSEKH